MVPLKLAASVGHIGIAILLLNLSHIPTNIMVKPKNRCVSALHMVVVIVLKLLLINRSNSDLTLCPHHLSTAECYYISSKCPCKGLALCMHFNPDCMMKQSEHQRSTKIIFRWKIQWTVHSEQVTNIHLSVSFNNSISTWSKICSVLWAEKPQPIENELNFVAHMAQ